MPALDRLRRALPRAARRAALVLPLALGAAGCAARARAAGRAGLPPGLVRVTTFGDSNTDMAWSPDEPRVRARSYVSDGLPRPRPDAPNAAGQLAGLVEGRWARVSARPLRAVNHAISGTTTGGGGHGGRDRNDGGAPNARATVRGVTRYEAEVLGLGFPWAGGEPRSAAYPAGPVRRVNAYVPGPDDFAYVSMGTNDLANDGVPPDSTLANLAWMAERWTAAGHRADHLVFTTLAPHQRARPALGDAIVTVNAGIRALAARTGAGLIDLAAYTSADGGRTWRAAWMHVGDELHYTTAVREWVADQLVAHMAARVAPAARPAR